MDFLEKLLDYYKISKEKYLEMTRPLEEKDILDISSFDNADITVECLKKHVKNNSKILIYGDYDCDGMMATSILKIAFNKIGFKNVGYFIPNRYKDGYGLSVENTKLFIEKGYNLIITVDNGITQFEAIKLARENGLDVIICDHHEIKDNTLPDTPYIIHPIYSRCKSYCSGGYTSFVLATALLGKFDKYMFSLAAISIISDLMELQNENRDIVRYGIEILKHNHFPQIDLLAEDKANEIDEGVIGSCIAPKINSLGRMIDSLNVNLIVKYFASTDMMEINKIYNYINEINTQRKAITTDFMYEPSKFEDVPAVIDVLDVKEGIIGLLANKYLDLCNKPAFIFTRSTINPDILKGSIRSRNGISVLDMLNETSDILETYGGHECAGGLSLKEENFEIFKEKIYNFAQNHTFQDEEKEYIDISINEITLENMDIVLSLSPFGNGNKIPMFRVKHFPTNSFEYSRDGKHIIMKISPKSSILGFNYDPSILNEKFISFVGTFRPNYFRGNKLSNFIIKDFIIEK